jgi:hypothetical protein
MIKLRRLSTIVKDAIPAATTAKTYGNLSDSDRIFTNLYGSSSRSLTH